MMRFHNFGATLIKSMLALPLVLAALCLAFSGVPAAQDSNLDKLAVYKKVRQCTVKVYAQFDQSTAYHGTGVAIRRFSGDLVLVVTNFHVVNILKKGEKSPVATKISCKPWQGKDKGLQAYYLGGFYNDKLWWDFAFLLVRDPDKLIQTASVAQERSVKLGTRVYACGNPQDEEFLVDDGDILQAEIPGADVGQMIAHDALIEHGSSGGGLFNAKGELIAINTWMVDGRYGIAQDLTYFLSFFRFGECQCGARAKDWTYLSKSSEEPGERLRMEPGMNLLAVAVGKWNYDNQHDAVTAGGVSGIDEGRVAKDQNFAALLVRIGESISAVDRAHMGLGGTLISYDDAGISGVLRGTGDVALRMNDTRTDNNDKYLSFVYVIIGNPTWYIGVETEEPTDQEREKWNLWKVDEKGNKTAVGAKVTKVYEFSDAAAGGIKAGDFIVGAGSVAAGDPTPVTSKTLKSVIQGFRDGEGTSGARVFVEVRHEGKDRTVLLGYDGK